MEVRGPRGAGSVSCDSSKSNTTILDKGWNLISYNTALIFFITLGFVELLVEASGYRPFIRLNDLMPSVPDFADNSTQTNNTEEMPLGLFVYSNLYKTAQGLDTVRKYTVHITLAAHILLPYPVLMERQKVLLVPWLIMNLLRAVLYELLISIMGIAVCASYDVFLFPCLRYSALQGAQLGFTLYFWTSMHSFYHLLNKTGVEHVRVDRVMSTIKRSTSRRSEDRVLSVMSQLNDDDNTDVLLVERAAMAWIAREILENDEEYVTDEQFSQYLVVKATMEMRQALRELAAKKKQKKREMKKLSPQERIEDILEFMRYPAQHDPSVHFMKHHPPVGFETSRSLHRRDPIRSIRPLTLYGRPVTSDMSLLSRVTTSTGASEGTASSVESGVQTEPPTHHMSHVLDLLEYQQRMRKNKMEGESHSDSASF